MYAINKYLWQGGEPIVVVVFNHAHSLLQASIIIKFVDVCMSRHTFDSACARSEVHNTGIYGYV